MCTQHVHNMSKGEATPVTVRNADCITQKIYQTILKYKWKVPKHFEITKIGILQSV